MEPTDTSGHSDMVNFAINEEIAVHWKPARGCLLRRSLSSLVLHGSPSVPYVRVSSRATRMNPPCPDPQSAACWRGAHGVRGGIRAPRLPL